MGKEIALIQAIKATNAEQLQSLLRQPPPVSPNTVIFGWPLLCMAAENSHKQIIDVLLQAGASVDSANSDGATPLSIAAQKGHKKAVEVLLQAGAQVNLPNKNDSVTALFLAAQEGHNEIVELLIRAGAQINVARKDGMTPLLIATNYNHTKVIELLLKAAVLSDLAGKEKVAPPSRDAAQPTQPPLLQMAATAPCESEMVLDLHGYSVEQAKFRVLHVLAQAYNLTKIRIITGRGNHANASGERGILYKNLRSWLTESSYQTRIEKIFTGDGYYEIFLHGTTLQQQLTNQLSQCVFHDLFPNMELLKTEAAQGDINAQYLIAIYLIAEAKNDGDLKKSFDYLVQAANSNHANAMVEVARSYLIGRGTRQNDAKAVEWLLKAHALNQPETPLLLGDCYWFGYGVEQNDKAAVSYYANGALKNDPVCMRKIASAYNNGYGVEKNLQQSFTWYKKAADMGEVTSQYNVATMYENGHGSSLPPDAKEAYKYFLMAANGGDPDAQCKIASCYIGGKVVPEDVAQAEYWLNLAAENGSAQAAEMLKRLKPMDVTLLQRSAQAGNILDSVELKVQQRGLAATADGDMRDKLFMESYQELRDLPENKIPHLEHASKFFLIDQLLLDKNKEYQQKALYALQIMSDGRCIFSLRRLAHVYHNGLGVKKDDAAAVGYLEQARQLSDAKSIMALGDFYRLGVFGKTRSPKQAMSCYEEAADLDYPPANYCLGLLYLEKGDTQKGMTYLQKAIKMEMAVEKCKFVFASGFIDKYTQVKQKAAAMLGKEYLFQQQFAKGYEYMQQAAEWGDERAKRFLANAKVKDILDRASLFAAAEAEEEAQQPPKATTSQSFAPTPTILQPESAQGKQSLAPKIAPISPTTSSRSAASCSSSSSSSSTAAVIPPTTSIPGSISTNLVSQGLFSREQTQSSTPPSTNQPIVTNHGATSSIATAVCETTTPAEATKLEIQPTNEENQSSRGYYCTIS